MGYRRAAKTTQTTLLFLINELRPSIWLAFTMDSVATLIFARMFLG